MNSFKLHSRLSVLLVMIFVGTSAALVQPSIAQTPATDKKFGAAQEPQGKPGETDQDKLQGNWQIASLELGGMVIKREDQSSFWRDTFAKAMFFKGDRYGQVDHSSSKFSLDESRSPKQITVVGDDGQLTYRGIYSLDGDTLTICMNGDGTSARRPEEFVAKKGTSVIITTLNRETAKEKK